MQVLAKIIPVHFTKIEILSSNDVLFQLQLQYTREFQRIVPQGTLCSSLGLMEKMSLSGYCDVLYVNDLGLGINRGAMNFGRLYQVVK